MAAIPSTASESAYPFVFDEPREHGLVRKVALAWEYPVHFTREVFSWENLTLARALTRRAQRARRALVVVVERAVAAAHPSVLEDALRYVDGFRERLALATARTVDPRDPALAEELQTAVAHAGGSVAIVAVGGHALQEVTRGAAASTRTPVLCVPTSALAQVELASATDVGAPPLAVVCDVDFLRTLPRRATRAGVVVAIECALRDDPSLFEWLRVHAGSLAVGDPQAVHELVRKCATPHAERHERALVFGRWSAPVLSRHGLTHAEALAVAIAIDAVRSAIHGVLDAPALDTVLAAMEHLAVATAHPILHREEVRRALVERMRAAGASSSTLLASVGKTCLFEEVDDAALLQAIEWLRRRA